MDIAMTLTALEGMIDSLKTKTGKERVQALVTIRSILKEFHNYIDRSEELRETPEALAHISQMLAPLEVRDPSLAKIIDTRWLTRSIAYLRSRKCFNVY